jgi:hypothetical protein
MRTAFLALLLAAAPAVASEPRPLEIFFIDVMGGAATLVVTPEGESILLDTGWPGENDRDPKRIAHVLREVAGLDHLDHLVTTHWHMDHYGGVGGLAKLVRIEQFWDRGLPTDKLPGLDFPDGPKPDDPLLVAYLAAAGDRRKTLGAGDRLPLKGDLQATVLVSGGHPAKPGQATPPANPACADRPADKAVDHSDNARSLGVLFRLGAFDFLDLGDLTWNIEAQLSCPADLTRDPGGRPATDGAVDLYQVTHHGMDISNHPTLLQTITPTVSVMNNGPRKGGSAAVVKLLRGLPSLEANYQLHKNAATGVDDNAPAEFIANANPAGGQIIRVTVAPDGKSFTVRFGAEGEARTYEIK